MDPNHPTGTPWRILERLKRRGATSIPELAREAGLSPESIRAHVRGLVDRDLVQDVGSRGERRGRPERLYTLTRQAEALFPRRESEFLQGLAAYLTEVGEDDLMAGFLERFARERRDAATVRLEGLEGRARLDEVARILTEEGYMAEIRDDGDGASPRLRLCHCPVRELVDVTRAPCKAEIGFVRALVGGGLARVEYIPDGDAACSYAVPQDRVP